MTHGEERLLNTRRSSADTGLVTHGTLPSGYRRFLPAEIACLAREMGIDTEQEGPGTEPSTQEPRSEEGVSRRDTRQERTVATWHARRHLPPGQQ